MEYVHKQRRLVQYVGPSFTRSVCNAHEHRILVNLADVEVQQNSKWVQDRDAIEAIELNRVLVDVQWPRSKIKTVGLALCHVCAL